MSRGSTSSAQSLAELERLEQQITLTLQGLCSPPHEIDQNFNRAHRIVSTSILPIIEQYRDHSNALWEASKFWKQFFEASANITLCGVEENEQEEEDFSYAQSHENASAYGTSQADETFRTEGDEEVAYDQGDESLLDDPDLSGSTPRAPRPKSASSATFAKYPSSYEALKQELKGKGANDDDAEVEPTTPGPKQRIPDMSMTPQSSPFDPTLYEPTSHLPSARPGADHLLHRVLDKNYRLQATPHTTRKENKTPANKPSWRDSDSPMSSPTAAAPELRADIFSSPVRQQYTRPIAPRTPGISVQTPAKGKYRDILQSRDVNADPKQTQRKLELPAKRDEISWESDSDNDADDVYKQLGMSPPKTIQFSLPQSRLLQTPAREASKRIVEELMTTAGGAFDDSDMLEDSPSVVQMKDDLDDSF